jgi:hypothetical protein
MHRVLQIPTCSRAYGQVSSLASMSLVQQLNHICNTTVKGAVQRSIATGYISTPTQILPQEDIAIVIWGNKITSDVPQSVRFHASKEIAQGPLADTKKWPHNRFNEVDWEHLDLAMTSTSNMYKIWRSTTHQFLWNQGPGWNILRSQMLG